MTQVEAAAPAAVDAAAAHPLDNPAWSALTGPHAHIAEVRGSARRYPVDVSPFVALPDDPSPQAWADLALLAGAGAVIPATGVRGAPAGWEVVSQGQGVQLVDAGVDAVSDDEAVPLGPADATEMLDLVARTQPGPFLPRTVDLGGYLGIRRKGRLVAMAGQRLHPRGWTEISAVCTDAEYRGQGLAGRLVRAVAAGIRANGDTPFMHAAAANTNAIRLYETLGFRLRRRTSFTALRVPANPLSKEQT
jgi:ribosomal protein S18 acetylase RimI-like enzyme